MRVDQQKRYLPSLHVVPFQGCRQLHENWFTRLLQAPPFTQGLLEHSSKSGNMQNDPVQLMLLKINRLLPMTTINRHMKFDIEIPKQTRLTLRKPCHLQSPETKKSNMATRRPFWKRRCWKSIGSYPYTWVLCPWSLKLIFKAKVKLESGNQKFQYGHQAAIL